MQIVDFRPEHAAAFRALNEAWLAKHLRVEPSDLAVLKDPMGAVVERGGRVFMAVEAGEAVGCVALLPLPDGGYELGRMAVSETARGGGVGRALVEKCIQAATAAGAPRLYLEASSVLAPALSLYRAMGFKQLPRGRPGAPPDARIDIWMERSLP
jgi:putative acetyltransferase